MRVIAGDFRGKRLETLPGEDVTRPTTERVKEGMFSSIHFLLPGARVLDLFAGSGQLGLEAMSRGAARCVFLDESREAIQVVMKNCKNCGVFDRCRVSLGDARLYLGSCREQFDLILMDPPYHHDTCAAMLPLAEKVLAPGGVVICETEREADMPGAVGSLTLEKRYQYGTIAVWRYMKERAE